MRRLRISPLSFAILLFCLWSSSDLAAAWRNSPLDHWGWLAFAIWLAPLSLPEPALLESPTQSSQPILLGSALGLTLAGGLGSLNALKYIGFACAVVGLKSGRGSSAAWLAGSICWMPMFGYAISHVWPASGSHLAAAVHVLRVFLSFLTVGGVSLARRRRPAAL